MKDRIRLIMEQTGLSQQDFAARLQISPASLSSIFTGRTNPTNNHVMAIHRAFPDINVNWLLFGEGEMRGGSSASTSDSDDLISVDASSTPSPLSDAPNSSPATPGGMPSMFSVDAFEPAAPTHPSVVSPTPSAHQRPMRGQQDARPMVAPRNMNIIDKPERKIKEIRVFYDDGTYEAFVPSSK